ncbi:hypothetical protein Vretimale_1777 [Volvox reticuliferus]|uniref:Uncharacterized protein n=1 Tax=Volvox reticuliferus TaxID=1737510 RepID=A0A8J4CTE7_9CHLO|nr:hypothetical protein Vretifemale_15348 [Volvox reticuliferus]GIL95844.1 hypothetical protein Vretimale_1777 [Volvox reticuliferus]
MASCRDFVTPGNGQDGIPAMASAGNWVAWLLGIAAVVPGTCNADTRQSAAGPPSLSPMAAVPVMAAGGGDNGASGFTNHPLEYDPVTNEHTARMTLARTAALEFYNAGKYAQAEAKFREAVAEAQLGFEPNDPHIASAKNNLAEFLRNTGRWDEAEALYKDALDLLERNFGEKHWLFVAALHNLALSYEARGDLSAARATMERVLSLRLSMFGPHHFLYADSLFALGHMLRMVPEHKPEGLRMMSEAVRLLEEAERVQVSVVLYWLTEIGNAHITDGRPDLAATALRRAVAHMATERGDEAAAASALNEQLTEILAAGGRLSEAVQAAEAALSARRRIFGESALVVAQSEIRVAQLLLAHLEASSPAMLPKQLQAAEGPGPALRALQHAEAAARISAANVHECSQGGMLSGPPPDRLLKRLRAAHTLGSAAKLVATLAGVGNPVTTAVATSSVSSTGSKSVAKGASGGTSLSFTSMGTPETPRRWLWWPFRGKGNAKLAPLAAADEASSAPQPAPQAPSPPPEPVADLALADARLEQAVAALTGALQAGAQLLQAVGSGRRHLPQGVNADELAGLLVEAQLQLLDVLDRLGLVLQARVAAGQGAAAGAAEAGGSGDVVERHRRVLEQQERVAAELLA